MFHTNRVRETYTEHAPKCLVSPNTGDNFASMTSVSQTSGFFQGDTQQPQFAMNSPRRPPDFSSSHAQADMRAWKRMQAVSSNRGVRCGAEVTYAGRNGTGKFTVWPHCALLVRGGSTQPKREYWMHEQLQTRHIRQFSHHLPQVSPSPTPAFRHFDESPLRARVTRRAGFGWEDGAPRPL